MLLLLFPPPLNIEVGSVTKEEKERKKKEKNLFQKSIASLALHLFHYPALRFNQHLAGICLPSLTIVLGERAVIWWRKEGAYTNSLPNLFI